MIDIDNDVVIPIDHKTMYLQRNGEGYNLIITNDPDDAKYSNLIRIIHASGSFWIQRYCEKQGCWGAKYQEQINLPSVLILSTKIKVNK